MTTGSEFIKVRTALDLIGACGVVVNPDGFLSKVAEFQALCSTWNLAAKLMSTADLSNRFDEHVADSLSLVPYFKEVLVNTASYVDIGSGAGFPAIPLVLAQPPSRSLLIERSEVKSAFLRQLVARLGLQGITIVTASYPAVELPESPLMLTARAVEAPAALDAAIVKRMRPGDIYLAQRDIRAVPGIHTAAVEELDDEFSKAGLRRGKLYRYRA